jgi:hypothetical protein
MLKANVSILGMAGLDDQLDDLIKSLEGKEEIIANNVAANAIASSAFSDGKTGKLRKSIKARESKFENGGWTVEVKAPHAHLVEYGHVMLTHEGKPTKKGFVPGRPFLRPAVEQAYSAAIAIFTAGNK